VVWLTPVLAGMVISAPLAYLTGLPGLGLAARRHGWFLIPEEVAPPPELAELDRHAEHGAAPSHDDMTPVAAVS
jgi:membrane glycosyltransferase